MFRREVRIPKGINIHGPAYDASPEIKKCHDLNDAHPEISAETDWGYIFVHNSKVTAFADRLLIDDIPYFVHKSVVYQRNKKSRGIITVEKPTVSGLIFLQGSTKHLQQYLSEAFPTHHLVKDCSTRLPAVIPDRIMQPFMRVLDTSPDRVRFLLHPFKYYAAGNVKLRITSGFLAGIEGYVVRIDRDRRLVMDVGGMSVAISGVHCEKFEVVE